MNKPEPDFVVADSSSSLNFGLFNVAKSITYLADIIWEIYQDHRRTRKGVNDEKGT